MRRIICALTVTPCEQTYRFFCDIKLATEYEVYIVVDNNNHIIPGTEKETPVPIIKVCSTEAEQKGYKSCIRWLNNKAASRDKALYYFTHINPLSAGDTIWFVEEDVFIPSVYTIRDLDTKYPAGDLLAAKHMIQTEQPYDWHWKYITQQLATNSGTRLGLPYACSMICAIRCSKSMLDSIANYAADHGNLFMDEALFNTLALHDNLSVICIPELSTIVYRHDWKEKEIERSNLYHPVKDISVQYTLRRYLEDSI